MSCRLCQGTITSAAGYEICEDCGDTQTRYIANPYDQKINYMHRENQVQRDFDSIALPQKIRDDATNIYIDVVGEDTLKRDRRKAMMCKCAYEAFKQNGVARDPIMLAYLFGINVKKLRKAQKDFHEKVHQTGKKDKYPKTYLSAGDLLAEFLTLFGFKHLEQNPDVKDLYNIIEKLYDSSMITMRYRPRDVAIVVAYMYYKQKSDSISSIEVHNTYSIPKIIINDIMTNINKLGSI